MSAAAVATALLHELGAYWDAQACEFYRDASGQPGPVLSARFLADLALGYLARGVHGGEPYALRRIPAFLHTIAGRQDRSGAFRWNLPDPGRTHPDGVRDQVDLAMVIDALFRLLEAQILSAEDRDLAVSVCLKAAAYLATAQLPGYTGIILKRHYERPSRAPLDVLNGDAMAARAFDLVGGLPGGERHHGAAAPFVAHLIRRFGRHEAGWWPYAETPADQCSQPPGCAIPTIFFQSMMIIHLRPLADTFPALQPVLRCATDAVARGIGPDGEADPAFESREECRNKPNALVADALQFRFPELAEARLRLIARHHLTQAGEACQRDRSPMEDKWRIWFFSDLGRLLLAHFSFRSNHQKIRIAFC